MMTANIGNKKLAVLLGAMFLIAAISGPVAVLEVQQAYAQEATTTSADPVASVTQLVVAVGALVGSVATIVSLLGSKYLARNGDNELVKKIVHGADGLKGTDEALAEAQEDIAILVDVVTRVSPEAKAELANRGKDIEDIRRRALEYKRDVDRLYKVAEKYS